MNNYEVIIQGGIDVLVETVITNKCYYCDEVNNMCNYRCREHITNWMRKEYIEDDSIEKLVAELRECAKGELSPICAYGHDSEQSCHCVTCSLRNSEVGGCARRFSEIIADRIERLVNNDD